MYVSNKIITFAGYFQPVPGGAKVIKLQQMKKIQIINGPNLNLLGKREPTVYGNASFEGYLDELRARYPQCEIAYFQSNIEGEMIDKIHETGFEYAYIHCIARRHKSSDYSGYRSTYFKCTCTRIIPSCIDDLCCLQRGYTGIRSGFIPAGARSAYAAANGQRLKSK